MKVRHIAAGTQQIEIEMLPAEPVFSQAPQTKEVWVDSFDDGISDSFASVRTDSFKDSFQDFVDESKAEFSAKETALSVAGVVPEILKELSHQIPGLSTIVTGSFLAEDLSIWRKLQVNIKLLEQDFLMTRKRELVAFNDFLDIHPDATHEQIIENTFLFTLAQLYRRSNKFEQGMLGKTFQLLGSIMSITALFTHGLTAIPSLIVGGFGTAIKVRVLARSIFNYVKKILNKRVNREAHARYLYGLTLLYLFHQGHHDGNCLGSKEALKSVLFVQNIPGDYRSVSKRAVEFLSHTPSLAFLKELPANESDMKHFMKYGFWTIMKEIKT